MLRSLQSLVIHDVTSRTLMLRNVTSRALESRASKSSALAKLVLKPLIDTLGDTLRQSQLSFGSIWEVAIHAAMFPSWWMDASYPALVAIEPFRSSSKHCSFSYLCFVPYFLFKNNLKWKNGPYIRLLIFSHKNSTAGLFLSDQFTGPSSKKVLLVILETSMQWKSNI